MDFRCPKLHSRVERSTRTEYCLQHNCTRCVASVLRRSFIAQPRRRECGDSSVECCRLPPSPPPTSFQSLSCVSSCPSALYSRHLAATPSPPCSVPDRTPLRSRSPPPLSAIRRRGRFHSRFCLAGAARKTCNTSTPLCPTDRPTEGGAAFSASSTRPLACSCRSFLVSCHPRVKCFKKRARPPPPRPQADIHSLRARSHGGHRGGGAAALPPGWLPLPGLLVLVVISIGRRSGRGERRQCAATPISQSRRIDWAIEEEERQRRSYLLEDEEAFEVFEVGDRY